MEFLKKAIRFVLFTILFIGLGVYTIFFLKAQYQSTDIYEPTISLDKVDNLSNTEIAEKLFIMHWEHYKRKPLFDNQRIEDYKVIGISECKYITDGTEFTVTYLVKQRFWNDYWNFGGKPKKGGMVQQFRYLSLIKEKEQFRLKLRGLDPPPHPKN